MAAGTERLSEHVAIRDLGGARVAVFDLAAIHTPAHFPDGIDWITDDTDVDDRGRAVFGLAAMTVERPGATIVVDPSTWAEGDALGGAAVDLVPLLPLDEGLAAAGVHPEAVTHVLISHGHHDHFTALVDGAGALRFPNAEHFFPAADWRDLVENDDRGRGGELLHYLGPVRDAGRLTLVESDREIVAGVTMLHTPGESAGHMCVRVDGESETLYYLGDLVHFPAELLRFDWVGFPRDADTVLASRRRIVEDARGRNAVFLWTHGRFPAFGTLEELSPDSWRWSYEHE